MATESVPCCSIPKKDEARVKEAIEIFRKAFHTEPKFAVHSPGRVNLIGEHIDYCGYDVFPMAVELDFLLVVGLNDLKKLRLRNANKKYVDYEVELSRSPEIASSLPQWFDYFLCGMRAIFEHFNDVVPVGMDIMVWGTVPPGAGLSSSSALVCSAAIATLHAHELKMEKTVLASVCAKCERYVGVNGGGMDQAICILAEKDCAKLISFEPKLSAQTVRLPDGAVFVVANSCVEMNKGASNHYNIRVAECRLAAQMLVKKHGLSGWEKALRIGDAQRICGITLNQLQTYISNNLHEEPYSREELCQFFGVGDDQLIAMSLSENTRNEQEFKLRQRALHVVTEAYRVDAFRKICVQSESNNGHDDTLKNGGDSCQNGASNGGTGDKKQNGGVKNVVALEQLGELMNASHLSCQLLYECSHPQLDELVELARAAGAYGSRLTGAGWGGCSVSLVPKENIAAFMSTIEKKFYAPRGLNAQEHMFVSTPASGAAIFDQLPL